MSTVSITKILDVSARSRNRVALTAWHYHFAQGGNVILVNICEDPAGVALKGAPVHACEY